MRLSIKSFKYLLVFFVLLILVVVMTQMNKLKTPINNGQDQFRLRDSVIAFTNWHLKTL